FKPTTTKAKRISITINLAIFPLNYFFSFLYYTDPLSTLLHLLMHYLWIKKCYKGSAVAGFFALLTRQTAIVWIFFHGILTLVKTMNEKSNGPVGLIDYVRRAIYRRREILQNSFGYAMIGVMFAIFVYLNGGIVLGDRSNHQVTWNIPQFLYFTLFTGVCGLPHLISQMPQLVSFIKSNQAVTVSISVAYALIVRFNTVAHWYNLSDPHHFTHYFITAVYNNPYFALALVPLYTICTVFIVYNSFRALDKWTASAFLFVIAMNLIFQLLLEMRYFIVAFVLFRLLIPTRKWSVLASEFCFFVIVNVVTISLYILRPRLFPDDENDFQLLMY
ncbi:putative Dol-P-Glc:Glc(2)Man(9)GlcNAc(2)-PP-Dol alpha-1,2-glucosyltransferase, partial [Bradysia coprophila]|uniref:putative Dol-P-Glc:Glc(2)Man(9)GlcNAc(2)-PP-Dol alpha-1,2-glucosyltransferase n=1 Tax=Bradysia coprophila TaxID=38358 RepID=UPI00187DD44E